jgi:hypothetical protein
MESANDTEKNLLNGFYNQFMSILKSYGVDPIQVEVNDSFDYSLHEALTSVEKEDVPENRILEIVQDGFKYGKEVIRYTKVIISKKLKPPEPEPEVEEDTVEEGTEKESEIIEETNEKSEIRERKKKDKKKQKK